MKLGIDLDHTIINYHDVFLRTAKQKGLVPDVFSGDKDDIKKHIQSRYTEKDWMSLQGCVYGDGIRQAKLMPYIAEFLQFCRQLSIPFVIISHKTKYGHFDANKIDLRNTARGWLAEQQFFDPKFLGLQDDELFFTETRGEKLAMIRKQQCTLFIDDLLDLLLEPEFPANIHRVWYAYGKKSIESIPHDISVIDDWRQAIGMLKSVICLN